MRTFIIAEAGVNHNGSINLAKQLIDIAADARADAVKFQTFKAERLVTRYAKKAQYQMSDRSGMDDTQFEMLKGFELTEHDHRVLTDYCILKKIIFLSTPFDEESVDLLIRLGVPFLKIPSGEATNYPYLVKIAGTGLPIVMSTGMCNLDEIGDAVELLKSNGATDITLLHCNTEYPTPYCDANINAIVTMNEHFKLPVGYSDHTAGVEAAIAAVALGAVMIEKHFTADKSLPGPDHKASLCGLELAQMVRMIRNTEKCLGNGIKRPTKSESKNIEIARKSIVANRNIQKNEIFNANNVTTKRAGNGISPMRWNEVLGQAAKKDYQIDDLIEI